MQVCIHCGATANNDNDVICNGCGKPISGPDPDTREEPTQSNK